MSPIELTRAQAELTTLVHQLALGEELTLTENGVPVARITATGPMPGRNRVPGLWLGKAVIIADDDEHLKDFAEYMQ